VQSADITQAFVSSYIYELPFGTGKRFHVGAKLVGQIPDRRMVHVRHLDTAGRQTAGVTTQASLPAIGSLRANVVGSQLHSEHDRSTFDPATQLYINRAAFAVPAAFSFGNSPRLFSQLRSFGAIQWSGAWKR